MVLARFLPQDERFFDYLQEVATNASEVGRALLDLIEHYEDVERKARYIRDLENRGDELAHRIFDALNRTFVTPLDREDITDLTGRLDDFVDAIEQAVRRIWLYRIEAPTEHAHLLARIINEQATTIAETLPHLRNRRQWDRLLECTIDIQRLENEADDAFDLALASQFDSASDVRSLIKGIRWGEIYQDLEDATDRAEDVADTLERIVVKNV
jgi:predicted phosphate transport protein (TIGR00153 family)